MTTRPARIRLIQMAVLVLAFTAAATEPGLATPDPEQKTRRVWIVGVDGAGWSRLDPLLDAGALPAIASLMARGVSADLETVEPVISPVVWTSIATGRSPAAHGVGDFLKRGSDIATPTVFERLAAQGVRVGVYDWLVAWPPQALPGGFVVPGWMRRDDATEPAGILDDGYRYRLRGVFGRPRYAENAREELREKPEQWRKLAETYDPQLGAMIFYAVDGVSHRFWQDAYPDEFEPGVMPDADPAYAGIGEEVLRGVDRAIGEISQLLGPDDVLILASDHGFQAAEDFRRVWSARMAPALARAGLVPDQEAFSLDGEFGVSFVRVHGGDFAAQDALLDRLYSFYAEARTEAGEPLFVVERIDSATRPKEAQRGILDRLRQWAVGKLLSWFFGIVLDPAAHAHLVVRPAGELLETLSPETPIRIGGHVWKLGEVIDADGFSGEHHPTAFFVAAGGPIQAVAQRGAISVLDIAPLTLWLLGSALPDDLEGRLPTEWLDPAALAKSPPRSEPAGSFPTLPRPEDRSPQGSEADLIERLRSMGYVE